jgi:hypothetical protein
MSKNYYDENYQEYFKNTIDADMSEMIERFLSYLKPGAGYWMLGVALAEIPKYFYKKDMKSKHLIHPFKW